MTGGLADVRLTAALCLGGSAGALARLGLTEWFPFHRHGWPWATLIANIIGTALLAYLVTRLQERPPLSTYTRPLLGTGFCGALTTFSTFQIELLELARNGQAGLAAGYGAVSIAAGLGCAAGVSKAARRLDVSR